MAPSLTPAVSAAPVPTAASTGTQPGCAPAAQPVYVPAALAPVDGFWERAHRRLDAESLAAAACANLLARPGRGLQLMAAAYARPTVEPIFGAIDGLSGRQTYAAPRSPDAGACAARRAPLACVIAILHGSVSLVALGVKALILVGASIVALTGLVVGVVWHGPAATAHGVQQRVFEGILVQGLRGRGHRDLAHLLREGYALWTEAAAVPETSAALAAQQVRRTAFAASFWQYVVDAGTGVLGHIDGRVLQHIGAKASAWGLHSGALFELLRGPAGELPWAHLLQDPDQAAALSQLWKLFADGAIPLGAPTLQQALEALAGPIDPATWTTVVDRMTRSPDVQFALACLGEMAPGALNMLMQALRGPLEALPWGDMVQAVVAMPHMEHVIHDALTKLNTVDPQQFAPLARLFGAADFDQALTPMLQALERMLAEKGKDMERAVAAWLDPETSGAVQRALRTLLEKVLRIDVAGDRWERAVDLMARLSAFLHGLAPERAHQTPAQQDDVGTAVDAPPRLLSLQAIDVGLPVAHAPEVLATWRADPARLAGRPDQGDRYATEFTDRSRLNADPWPTLIADLRQELGGVFGARSRWKTLEQQTSGILRMKHFLRAELQQAATGTGETKRLFAKRHRQRLDHITLNIDCALPKCKLIRYKRKVQALQHALTKKRVVEPHDEMVLAAVREALVTHADPKVYSSDALIFGRFFSESFYVEAANYCKDPAQASIEHPAAQKLLRTWRAHEDYQSTAYFLQLRLFVLIPDGVPYFNWLARNFEAAYPRARVLGVVVLREPGPMPDPDGRLVAVHNAEDLKGNLSGAIGHALSTLDTAPATEMDPLEVAKVENEAKFAEHGW